MTAKAPAIEGVVVKDLVTPLIAALGAQPDFGGLFFTINRARFQYGDFIDAVLTFVIIAAVVYFARRGSQVDTSDGSRAQRATTTPIGISRWHGGSGGVSSPVGAGGERSRTWRR